MPETATIDEQITGIPGVALGGYVCGLLARFLPGEVRVARFPAICRQSAAVRSQIRPVASAYAHAWTSGGSMPRPVRMAQICSRWAFA